MILSEIVSLSFEVEGAKVQIFMHVLKISSVKGVRQKLLRAGAHHQRSTTVYIPISSTFLCPCTLCMCRPAKSHASRVRLMHFR